MQSFGPGGQLCDVALHLWVWEALAGCLWKADVQIGLKKLMFGQMSNHREMRERQWCPQDDRELGRSAWSLAVLHACPTGTVGPVLCVGPGPLFLRQQPLL